MTAKTCPWCGGTRDKPLRIGSGNYRHVCASEQFHGTGQVQSKATVCPNCYRTSGHLQMCPYYEGEELMSEAKYNNNSANLTLEAESKIACQTCGGSGNVVKSRNNAYGVDPVEYRFGTAMNPLVWQEPCPTCHGTGTAKATSEEAAKVSEQSAPSQSNDTIRGILEQVMEPYGGSKLLTYRELHTPPNYTDHFLIDDLETAITARFEYAVGEPLPMREREDMLPAVYNYNTGVNGRIEYAKRRWYTDASRAGVSDVQ